jgi:hypothetical protein
VLARDRALPFLDETEDVAALRVRELELPDEPSQLARVVVRDGRLDSLANSLTLG